MGALFLVRRLEGTPFEPDECRAKIDAAGLGLHLEVPDGLTLIQSDTTRIRQILGNLISNAVHYTPQGGSVEVRAGERTEADGSVLAFVEVRDTGLGIPREKQNEIFREFTRLQPEIGRGAGVGLAISRRIALLLGGDLVFESTEGEGSTFTLLLPKPTSS